MLLFISTCLAQTTVTGGVLNGGTWGLVTSGAGGGGGNPNCTSTQLTASPLVDLLTGCYQPGSTPTGQATGRKFQGGLYPTGVNLLSSVSTQADSDAKAAAVALHNLQLTGNSGGPKTIVMLCIGMSIMKDNCDQMVADYNASSFTNQATLAFIDVAQSGWNACVWQSATLTPAQQTPPCVVGPTSNPYDIVKTTLSALHRCGTSQTAACGETDVYVVFYMDTNATNDFTGAGTNGLPCTGNGTPTNTGWTDDSGVFHLCSGNADANLLEGVFGNTARAVKTRYPNVSLMFWSPRNYSYCPSCKNPEPFAYQNGHAMKHTIEDQLNQVYAIGTDDGQAGTLNLTTAPRLLWAGYTWAINQNPRASDSLAWCDAQTGSPCSGEQDYQADLLHPSTPVGDIKWSTGKNAGANGSITTPASAGTWAGQMDFFLNNAYARPWFHN